MTANQFRATLKLLNLSQRGAAKLFRSNERTFRRYAAGERMVPDDIARKLQQLVSGKITVQDIEAALHDCRQFEEFARSDNLEIIDPIEALLMRRYATHSDVATTARYSCGASEKIAEVMRTRAEARR